MSRNQREGYYAGKLCGKHRRMERHCSLRAWPARLAETRFWLSARNWISIDEYREELGIEQATDLLTGEIGRLEVFRVVKS